MHRTDDTDGRSIFACAFRPVIIVPALAILLLIAAMFLSNLGLQVRNGAQAAAADGPVVFHSTLAPQLKHSRLLGPANANQRISLSIGLHPSNEQALKAFATSVSKPKSSNFHRFLTPAQFAAAFAPGQSTYTAIQQFLRGNGFTITHTYSHRLSIAFSGTIGQAERAFGVKINNYAAANGHTFYANSTDPILPASLASAVESISGLNTATSWNHPPVFAHKLPVKNAPQGQNPAPGSIQCLGHDESGDNLYYTPDQIASAYNLDQLYNQGFHGEGQTVALFELDGYAKSDLLNYASCYGHAQTSIQTIVTGSGQVPMDSGVTEVELDAELVLSAAPKLGQLKIYEAANDTADYNAEWAQIIQDSPPVVSTSWGECEDNVGWPEANQENIFFEAAASEGMSVFAASGDSGSAGCAFDSTPSNGLNVSDPASQPGVTAVGGTSLSIYRSALYNGESAWNNPPDVSHDYKGGASGGGISEFWYLPDYQVEYNSSDVLTAYNDGEICDVDGYCRQVPDVSLNADPYHSYPIYCSVAAAGCDSSGAWYGFGGTSAAAPMWAAMTALANQMSVKAGGYNAGFLNWFLYWAAANINSDNQPILYDVNNGNNDYNNLNPGKYPATSGYDLATGLGSYNAFDLATALNSYDSYYYSFQSTLLTSSHWYFAEGSVGGGFQEYLTLQNPNGGYPAHVNVTYLFHTKKPVTVSHIVPINSRITVNVNADLHVKPTDAQQSLSTIVQTTNGVGIVAERPMYFHFKGIASGTDIVGTTTPQTAYYFPEANTTLTQSAQYYTYITILNPSSTDTATVTLTFYALSCGQASHPACQTKTVVVHPLQRATLTPPASLHARMAIALTSDNPVVAERPMYFKDHIATAGGTLTGAAALNGATTPGTNWNFAEGYTGSGFQEYLVLANFGETVATASVKLEYSNGHTQTVSVPVSAQGQVYFDVNAANANPTGTCDVNPCQTTPTVSATVTSDNPIVADRLMYFHYGSQKYSGGTETIGQAGTPYNIYAFAEGYTANHFSEFLTVQNPHSNSTWISVTYYVDGYVTQQGFNLAPYSRFTINVNRAINPMISAYKNMGSNSYAVSITVESGNGTVVVERPMYFNYQGSQGGTDVMGYSNNTCEAAQPKTLHAHC